MTRRLAALTLDNLEDLPESCRSCGFWELDPVRRERALRSQETCREKEAWASRVLLEWGSCGWVAYVDGDPAGYVLYAPPSFVPGADSFPTSPASEDAVLLMTAMIYPEYADAGLGRVLLQAVAKDLLNRGGIRAIEAFGDVRASREGFGGCVLPAEFLLRVGFKTHRAHGRYPRMRLELKSVLTWREEMENALERLIGVVRRPRPVSPAAERGHREQHPPLL
ncbi:MAG TPA: GNAT family N-acetyltransferase [Nocardioidaceae bacterium]|nr:GNAT family N-acetyltransferase [Nocardioidaceae bacterium]